MLRVVLVVLVLVRVLVVVVRLSAVLQTVLGRSWSWFVVSR